MKQAIRGLAVAMAVAAMCACSSMSTISSKQAGTALTLQDKKFDLPSQQNLKGTSFGNYEFKAVSADAPPFYGILPMKFKGGHLAVDIILFAPAAFFNLREAFPFYEIDVKDGVIRYKLKSTDVWTEYKPKPEETARAQNYFNAKAPN